jgi:hypothetical protein
VRVNQDINLRDFSVHNLTFDDCELAGLNIVDGTIKDHLEFDSSIIKSMEITNSDIGSLALFQSKIGDLKVGFSRLTIARLVEGSEDNVFFGSDAISSVLQLSSSANTVNLPFSTFGSVILLDSKLRKFSMSYSTVTDAFAMSSTKWVRTGTLKLVGASIHSWLVGDIDLPTSVDFNGTTFVFIWWGPNPLGVLTEIERGSPGYAAWLYPEVSEMYRRAGRSEVAREILAEGDAQFEKTSPIWWERGLYFAAWLLCDYGYRPEVGLGWILGFVLIGALIFFSGQGSVPANRRPASWLAFAFDAVLPGIRLDERHSKVAFSGWRQYFLYFLRFLGAVVVVIVLALLRRSIEIG